MTRIRLIVGLITHIVIYLTVTKPVKGGQDPTLGCSAIDDDGDDGYFKLHDNLLLRF
jgi:hypothetical protein